jgi:hypothetical protein
MPVCSLPEVHKDDVVNLRLALVDPDNEVIDVSAAAGVTLMEITVKKPSGDTFTKTAVYVNPPDGTADGTDGLIQITTEIGELDEVGPGYSYQGYVEFGASSPVHSSIEKFEVHDNL